jgi:hypothetical protein
VILKNVSKSGGGGGGLKLDLSKRGDTSSRSNSIRKSILEQVKCGSKKSLQNNNFVTSSINISSHEPVSPLNKTGDISQDNFRGNRC